MEVQNSNSSSLINQTLNPDDLLHVTQVYNVKQQIINNLRTIQASVPGLPRYSAFPSMKTSKNVDEKFKSQLPSMKSAENVDENCRNHEREHETEVDQPSKCF